MLGQGGHGNPEEPLQQLRVLKDEGKHHEDAKKSMTREYGHALSLQRRNDLLAALYGRTWPVVGQLHITTSTNLLREAYGSLKTHSP